jgi:NADPH:quinone reductase-like Zn-dependent oxidoreductase
LRWFLYPSVKIVPFYSTANSQVLQCMAEAVREGKLRIPISPRFPLGDAVEAQAVAEKGASGQILLVV